VQTRRAFFRTVAGVATFALTGRAQPSGARTVHALRSAADFISERQSPDGAWRSTQYGVFREGDVLTALILWAFSSASALASEKSAALARGLPWLEKLTGARATRDTTWEELRYPLFTASYAAQVFTNVGNMERAERWVDLVERLRINEALGWPLHDPACGAWSDSASPPQLPSDATSRPDMLAPNISATLLGLQALVAVGRAGRAASARTFLAQCQNFTTASSFGEFDDGGFFFAPDDPVRNKAGIAGRDLADRERYRSYGSATCDGIRALHACGVARDDPRMRAGMTWLRRHATGAIDGGAWPTSRSAERESLFYYHAQTLAGTLGFATACPVLASWVAQQKRALTSDLLARQESDGSWTGKCPRSFEDDPLVATAFAMRALADLA
jgi:hypothetical protein